MLQTSIGCTEEGQLHNRRHFPDAESDKPGTPHHPEKFTADMINKSLYLATWLTKPCFEYFMKLHLFTHPFVGGRSTGVLKSRNFILTCLYDNVTGFKFLHCPVWTLLLSLHPLIYVHRRMFSNAESAKFKTRTFPALNFPRLSQFLIGVQSLATLVSDSLTN